MKTDVTTLGEALIDLTQIGCREDGVPLLAANPGGAPANVAVAVSRLGGRAAFLGMVGKDGFGTYLREVLKENNVDTTGLCTGDAPTTMAIVSVDTHGERDFRFNRGADNNLSSTDVDMEQIGRSKFLHFGSISLTGGPSREATYTALREAKKRGVRISYDPNYRAALWQNEDEAIEWMKAPLPYVDIIKLSDEELPLITGTDNLERGTAMLRDVGISLVLVTLGGNGAFYRMGEQTGKVDGVKTTISDTNGAGDTFLGAVLCKLSARLESEPLSSSELEEILAYANRAASITCSRSGAIPAMPRAEEVQAL